MKSQRGGFTLLEIVIVCIIVGVIASLAFTNYGVVIEKARIKEGEQILMACAASVARYYTENNNSFPAELSQTDLDVKLPENFNLPTYENFLCRIERNTGLYVLQTNDLQSGFQQIYCVGSDTPGTALCEKMNLPHP